MSNRYYRRFIILTIYNGKSDIDVFWHKLNTYSTAEKIHPLVTTDQNETIDTIDINQIRFTDFYRLTTPGVLQPGMNTCSHCHEERHRNLSDM